MNFAEIEKTWQSAENQPSAVQLEKQKMHLIDELHRKRRASRGLLWLTAIPLCLITGRVVLHLIWPDPALDRVNLAQEWMIVPFYLLPWIGWFLIWRSAREHARRHADYGQSIQASVAALLDENRHERRRAQVVSALLLVSLPLIGGVIWQLRAVGKVGDEILIPAFVVYPAYVVLMVGWIAFDYARKMRPRQRELENLVAEYNRPA